MTDPEQITRVIMDNVPAWLAVAFYTAAFAACGFAGLVFIRRFLQYRQGRPAAPERPAKTFGNVAGNLIGYLLFHKELLRDRAAGIAHLLVFYGFLILFIGTCLVFLEHDTPLHFFYGPFYLVSSLIIDLGGVAFIVGLGIFVVRRLSERSGRVLREWWIPAMIGLLLVIGATGFLLEGARIAHRMPAHEKWSAVGYTVASAMRLVGVHGESALWLHRVLWPTHAVFCVLFFALLPWRFFGHMVYGAASWAIRNRRPLTELPILPLEQSPGAATWRELSWRDLLQTDACTTCGRCNDSCPASAAGKPLRPRDVVLGLRSAMGPVSVSTVGDVSLDPTHLSHWIADDVLWSCTTCGACNDACPVGIDVFHKIVDVRRGRVESGQIPKAAETLFESSAERFNPFGKPQSHRLEWAAGIDLPVAREEEAIELLYWVGCAGAFDPDGQSVARSMIKILQQLEIPFRVLGKSECCTGDPARRMGEEGLFRQLAAMNIETFRRHSVKRILTACPHCLNTFKNEYPFLADALDASVVVEHHSEFLARMIRERRIVLPEATGKTVTFHDPCYLGRGNGQTEAPRAVIGAVSSENREMPRHGSSSFCCGAGGGAMWLDVAGKTRVENIRAREAADTGAETLVTACPFCKGMLQAGKQSLEQEGGVVGSSSTLGDVQDLAELIVAAQGW